MPLPVTLLAALAFQVPTIAANTSGPAPAGRNAPPPVLTATAVRTEREPTIDGRDDDAIWASATPITELRQWQPAEDKDPRFRTEARIAYDPHNLYVFVRAYDPHPDSILKLLARRDQWTPADKIWIMIDSYHDRRSGYEFGVNPAGVKIDMSISDDGNEDDAWDAVWDVATTVDSLGWTAEYRIPLSQLRYAPGPTNVFGFAVWRDLQRYTEREAWPVLRRSRSGFVSQFGELHGLTGLASPRRLEVTPYTVAKSLPVADGTGGYGRDQQMAVGADVKYGITSNLTLDATVNPDFGQVESDPAVLNLSAFETFLQERRPFFVEGTGIFRFTVNCSAVNCGGEGLFYSRRIGRAPQLGDLYGDASSPTNSIILGAGKLTGHLPGGLTLGVVDAVTQRTSGTQDRTIEPATNYMAARLQQDFRHGESGLGAMVTMVNRDLDPWSDPYLRRNAVVGAADFRHRFLGSRYELTGSIAVSQVGGTPAAITATQRSSVHLYQRPDAGLTLDTTRTTLGGNSEEIHFGKFGGKLTRFETSYLRRSAGFEINDLGFLNQSDQQSWNNWFALQFNNPTKHYRRANWNFNWWQYWTAGGMATERAFNTNVHAQLANRWWIHAGGTLGQLGSTLCDNCTRGGPALRVDPYLAPWAGIQGDDRKLIVPGVFYNYFRGDGGRSSRWNISPEARLRVASNVSATLGVNYRENHDDTQFYGNFTDASNTIHYTFAHLEQTETSLSLRLDYTLTRTVSFQAWLQPFISKGTYSDVRELASARASDYASRYQPYGDTAVANNPGGFNYQQFTSNMVLRWEYRRGSTLFLVWQQGRQDYAGQQGSDNLRGDFQNLFATNPANTLLIKASYWLSW